MESSGSWGLALKWYQTTGELEGGHGNEADFIPAPKRLERGDPHELHLPPTRVFYYRFSIKRMAA